MTVLSNLGSVGVIAAGGQATRFNGYPKYMLPIPYKKPISLLQYHINSLRRYCDYVIVVGTEDNYELLDEVVNDCEVVSESYGHGMYGALEAAMEKFPAYSYRFAMADTWFPPAVWGEYENEDVWFGTFNTEEPERFGCFVDYDKIVDKPKGSEFLEAWGCFAISWKARSYLLQRKDIVDYTSALNALISEFGYMTSPIVYFDMATMDKYQEFLAEWNLPF